MSRRKDDAVFSLLTLFVVVAELAWLGVIAYLVLRLLRAAFPESPL